ncbi:NAD-dependent epimerase/dehydratase family protein [Microvirga sp. M2]|uniref:NAD-dependent epimerase/dehydratase family protein n=1 Tax=Microvirga sp. M2 TaxID=3073270 RepID=UPI0039C224F6
MSATLVTGGCGFIGRYLVSALRACGHHVRVLDLACPSDLPPDIEFLHGSILDGARLRQAMDGIGCVFHLAGAAHFWMPRREDFGVINGRGTQAVLQAAADMKVGRVVHCSTEAILLPKHSIRRRPIDENVLPPLRDMAGPYTRSKHEAEQAALEAVRNGQDVVIVSPAVPIGADDRNMTPPTAMLSLFLAGRLPFFLDCELNLVDVRDVATGIILAAERGRTGERYVLGGENIRLRALLHLLEDASGHRMPRHSIPRPVAFMTAALAEWLADHVTGRRPPATREGVRVACRSALLDCCKARLELGYAPVPIRGALLEAVDWLCTMMRVHDHAPATDRPRGIGPSARNRITDQRSS